MPIDHIPEKRIDLICDKLANEGFIILRDFLPEPLAVSLLDEAEILSKTHFSTAGIGRNDEQQINTQVRTDSTLWLTHDSGYQTEYL
ncbi:MAG: 2OG-Fe(II) oxygenase, partial [Paraglaciecola sp.]